MADTFRDYIAANKRNSVLLVLLFLLFTAAVAVVLALAVMYLVYGGDVEINWTRSLVVGGIALGISLLISLLSFFQGDKMVLGVSGAKQITHQDDPQLFNVVEEMAIAAG